MTQQISEIDISIFPSVTFQFRLKTVDGDIYDFNIEANEESVAIHVDDRSGNTRFYANFDLTSTQVDDLLTKIANAFFRHLPSDELTTKSKHDKPDSVTL